MQLANLDESQARALRSFAEDRRVIKHDTNMSLLAFSLSNSDTVTEIGESTGSRRGSDFPAVGSSGIRTIRNYRDSNDRQENGSNCENNTHNNSAEVAHARDIIIDDENDDESISINCNLAPVFLTAAAAEETMFATTVDSNINFVSSSTEAVKKKVKEEEKEERKKKMYSMSHLRGNVCILDEFDEILSHGNSQIDNDHIYDEGTVYVGMLCNEIKTGRYSENRSHVAEVEKNRSDVIDYGIKEDRKDGNYGELRKEIIDAEINGSTSTSINADISLNCFVGQSLSERNHANSESVKTPQQAEVDNDKKATLESQKEGRMSIACSPIGTNHSGANDNSWNETDQAIFVKVTDVCTGQYFSIQSHPFGIYFILY